MIGTQIAQGVPIGAVAREPRALIAQHDPYPAQGDLGQEGFIAIPSRGALRGAPQVRVDDFDARIRPAEPAGMVPPGML